MAPPRSSAGAAGGRGGYSRAGGGDGSASARFGKGGAKKGFEREAETHAERAAELLAKARASRRQGGNDAQTSISSSSSQSQHEQGNGSGKGHSALTNVAHAKIAAAPSPSRKVASGPSSERSTMSDLPIPLPMLLKSLVNPALGALNTFAVKEAIPLAGKLVRAKLNTQTRLVHLNEPVLEEAGVSSEQERHKILIAFGVRQVGQKANSEQAKTLNGIVLKRGLDAARQSTSTGSPTTKRQRISGSAAYDDERLSREYGNVTMPDEREPGLGGELIEYEFNAVLEEDLLRGRYAYVNRAPIMTAWTTIVLENLGFQRREALSIAHCYVNTTSTARGISLGIIPSAERTRAVHTVGSNQPHFELMGVKVPLMKLRGASDEWRGISAGQVVSPDQAFNYMRKSMFQTLPLVVGALTLLADSYVNATSSPPPSTSDDTYDVPSPDLLHARAYELYTQFRPETAGEWGKKSQFYCSKALALRRGHEADLAQWNDQHTGDDGGGGDGDTSLEVQEFEQELKALVAAQEADEAQQNNVQGFTTTSNDEHQRDQADDDKSSIVKSEQ